MNLSFFLRAIAIDGDIPYEAVQMARMFFVMLTVVGLGIPLIRALGKRWERKPLPPPSPDVTERLERIEQAVEAVAIEVERISEGQRFVTKLMSEQPKHRLPNSDPRA